MRQCRTDERHPEFVGTGLDRRAPAQSPALEIRAQRGEVAQMQAHRSGIVLAEDQSVEAAFGDELQRKEIDVAVAGAGREILVERRTGFAPQTPGGRDVGCGSRRVRQRARSGWDDPSTANKPRSRRACARSSPAGGRVG
jgi:hypothetical protein